MGYKSYIPNIKDGLDRSYYEILRTTAGQIEKTAKEKAPVDTGQLRQSIQNDADSKKAVVGTDVKHGVYQEFGTVKMKPRKYLRPAALANVKLFVDIARKILGRK